MPIAGRPVEPPSTRTRRGGRSGRRGRFGRGERRVRAALLALPLLTSPGCLTGWVYTNVTLPIVTDVEATPRQSRQVELSSHDVKFRGITWAEVNSRAIGDAAKRYGLHTIHFADQREVSFFGGLYRRRSVLVWGE